MKKIIMYIATGIFAIALSVFAILFGQSFVKLLNGHLFMQCVVIFTVFLLWIWAVGMCASAIDPEPEEEEEMAEERRKTDV